MSHTDTWDKIGMNQTPQPANYINVDLNQDTLATVVGVFEKMIEDPESIDRSMYDLTEFDEFEQLTERLKDISESTEGTTSVPMTFNEWATFSSYAAHAYDLDEDLTPEEEAVMVKVNADNYTLLKANGQSSEPS